MRRRNINAKNVMRLYSVRILIEKAFLSANWVGAVQKRGTKSKECMASRFGRNVWSDVRGLIPIVMKDNMMLSHSPGGARNGELGFPDREGGAERQTAR